MDVKHETLPPQSIIITQCGNINFSLDILRPTNSSHRVFYSISNVGYGNRRRVYYIVCTLTIDISRNHTKIAAASVSHGMKSLKLFWVLD